jgi:cell division protein FtsW
MRAAVGSGPVTLAKPRSRWLSWLWPKQMNAPWTQWVRGGAPSRGPDRLLCGAVLCLCAIGVVMVFSAGAMFAAKHYNDWTFFLKRELMYAGLGVVAFALALRTDYVLYRRLTYPMLFMSVLLLASVLVFGSRAGGAIRWFRLGPLSFQPSELAKFALVVYLAALLARKAEKVKQLWGGFLPPLIVTSILMAMLLKQPDLGTAAIFGFVALAMLFVAGTRTSYIILSILLASPVVYKAIVGTPWRMRRMVAFLDPWAHRRGAGYQVVESQISIGSGGLFGQGLGEGRQKLFFLPEAHTDFILAVIGEELGFLGVMAVLGLFCTLIWRGFTAAARARDAFGAYLAFGLTAVFGMQALINMAVVMGLVPTKGLTLPFVSYGGTSMIVSMFAAGVLGNISAKNPEPRRGESVLAGWKMALWPWGAGGNKRSDKGVRVVVETARPRRRTRPALVNADSLGDAE